MKKPLLVFGVLCALLVVAVRAQDQKVTPQAPAAQPETSITLDVNRVNMLFTVSDKKGRFVTDLAKEDFLITEEKKPQTDRRVCRRNRSPAASCRADRYQQQYSRSFPVPTGSGSRVHK